jgi:hypothetical protein
MSIPVAGLVSGTVPLPADGAPATAASIRAALASQFAVSGDAISLYAVRALPNDAEADAALRAGGDLAFRLPGGLVTTCVCRTAPSPMLSPFLNL